MTCFPTSKISSEIKLNNYIKKTLQSYLLYTVNAFNYGHVINGHLSIENTILHGYIADIFK